MVNNQEMINKYAEALLSVAKTHHELSAVKAEVDALIRIISENQAVLTVFELSSSEFDKQRALLDTLKGQAMPHVQNFLEVLFQNRRLPFILEILNQFNNYYRKETQTGQVVVTSAVVLDKQQLNRLSEQIKTKFGFSSLEIEQKVQPQIIGGIIVELDNKIIDGSIKTQLEKLAELIR